MAGMAINFGPNRPTESTCACGTFPLSHSPITCDATRMLSYANEEPVPETRDMEIGDDGIRVIFDGQDLSSFVWRISAPEPITTPGIFYMPEGDWVYGPDGRWVRWSVPQPRTVGQRIHDALDRLAERLNDRIDAMQDAWAARVNREAGEWRPSDQAGSAHGTYTSFDTSDMTQTEIYDRVRALMIYPPDHPSHQPHPAPEFDYYAMDPAQWDHGMDGGVPMSLEDLIGADEAMDAIDRLFDQPD